MTRDKFWDTLPRSRSFDAANEQWYEDMIRRRESEKWSRESLKKCFDDLEDFISTDPIASDV